MTDNVVVVEEDVKVKVQQQQSVLPDDDTLRNTIFQLVPTIDIETMGIKSFMKLLAKEMNISNDLLKTKKKDFIKQTLTEAINQNDDNGTCNNNDNHDDDVGGEAEDDNDQEEDDDDQNDDQEDVDRKPNGKSGGRGGGGGLSQKKQISHALAKLLGKTKDTDDNSTTGDNTDNNKHDHYYYMARTEVVKELWNYVRLHNLQNPNNKREIILDTNMQNVFHCTMFTMFTMNKYISAHIEPYTPVDLTPKYKESNKRSRTSTTASGRRRRGTTTTTTTTTKKPRKVGQQPPYLLSNALQLVVGTNILPRPQVVSKLWSYIKQYNLQNPNDKREIICDTNLRAIFDNKTKISMFQMNVYLGKHFIEKVDKSQYHHMNDDDDDDKDDNDDDDQNNNNKDDDEEEEEV